VEIRARRTTDPEKSDDDRDPDPEDHEATAANAPAGKTGQHRVLLL
jgi:hypothetical protein